MLHVEVQFKTSNFISKDLFAKNIFWQSNVGQREQIPWQQ